MKSQIRDNTMYKHSFGHFPTNTDAIIYMRELEEKYPKKEFNVVLEKRSDNTWMKYCVCEYVPFKRDKDKVQKSNSRRKNRHTHKNKKHINPHQSK